MSQPSKRKELLRELSAFGLVGVVATGVYAVVANAAIYLLGVEAKSASVFGFVIGSVFSFFAQGRVTFQVDRPDRRNVIRFCAQTIISLLISYYAIWVVVDLGGYPAILGTIIVCILIPAFNYLGMKFFVFRRA